MTEREMDIYKRLQDHFDESLELFPENQIVGLFLQGSQNYGLDIKGSDIDTKLIVVPSFKDIALNKKPVSTTHIRANDEHIDFKDVRLYMETFRKQNLNFLEVLFTEYFLIPAQYYDQWYRLVANREDIARMNEYRAVKSMKGIALEKYHAMEHPYPSKVDILAKYGYDGKQIHHLVRVEDYLTRYINGEAYEKCLIPSSNKRELLLDLKMNKYGLDEAREIANRAILHITEIADDFCTRTPEGEKQEIRELLEDVQYEIMKIAVLAEFNK